MATAFAVLRMLLYCLDLTNAPTRTAVAVQAGQIQY
jgi:hypothetical protein